MNNEIQQDGAGFQTLVLDDSKYQTRYSKKFANRKPYTPPDPMKLSAFIPGTIIELFVKKGQKVRKGDKLLILEAMKMKNIVLSAVDGTIKKVHVNPGDKVAKNQLLIEFE